MARNYQTPAYQRIAADWAEKIDSGQLVHGDQLPTRDELQEQYDVSRQVIRDALNVLHQEGYLTSRPSKGTFVHRLPVVSLPMYILEAEAGAVDAFVKAVQEQGHEPHQDIRVETIKPDAYIRDQLELKEDDLVLVRRRMRTVNGVPYAIADSFFPHALVEGTPIANPADITTGGRHVLADLGIPMNGGHSDSIRSRRPHPREITELDIAPGLAVTEHNRTSRTAGSGRPVRHMTTILPSDRWVITYEVP